jgi:RNA polymerase sigma-70 factor (ECF subfamily)
MSSATAVRIVAAVVGRPGVMPGLNLFCQRCSDSARLGRRSGIDESTYRAALPQVYGYLLPRCGSVADAEDLTAETFMAAVAALKRPDPPSVSVAWLIGVARHKLVDHWRRSERERRGLAAVGPNQPDDPWEELLDTSAAYSALARLPGPQRAALSLRYLDGLTVTEIADHLDRTVRGTETLLVRARAALRRIYREEAA